MKNEVLSELEKLYNRHDSKKIKFEEYISLFDKIAMFIENVDINSEQKDEIIYLLISVINTFEDFGINVDKLPIAIQQIYYSEISFKRIFVVFDQIQHYDQLLPNLVEEILLQYLEFLYDPKNELYIQCYFSKINNINEQIIGYLKNSKLEEVSQLNQELLEIFYEKVDFLKQKRPN